jgi:hypothetical protein
MHFYPSKTNDRLNREPFQPETINGRVMLNPKYPIKILNRVAPWRCDVCECKHTFPQTLMDSGAFQDIDDEIRLLPWSALDRQTRFEEQLRWSNNDHTFHCEALCIYDQMAGVDEAIVDGKKVKRRGTQESARAAVEETLRVAEYYARNRDRVRGRLMFAGQGVDANQYVNNCVIPMMDVMRPGDYFAFGGFCIIGKMPKRMMPVFAETLPRVLDTLIPFGIRRFHLLGVMYPEAVTLAAGEARRRGVEISTDSSGAETSGVHGRIYIEGRQVQKYTKEQKYIDYFPCQQAHTNIRDYHEWSSTL